MSKLGDTWASGPPRSMPAAPAGIPDRPDKPVAAPATWAPLLSERPVTTVSSYQTVPAWKRFGAGLGVFWAFWFFLTIPGWLTLMHFRKWRRGEIPTPNGLILWGLSFSAFVGTFILVAIATRG